MQANVVNSAMDSNAVSFENTDYFIYAIGDVYGSNASAVVINEDNFNSPADWAQVNVAAGALCWRVNTCSETLAMDMANSVSKTYTSNLWLINNNSESVLLSSGKVTINNVAVEPN
jgi:hypothetical protein